MTTIPRESAFVWQNSSPAIARSESRPVADTAERAEPIRVVMVDDDADYREAMAGELQDLGFDVVALPDAPALFDFFSNGCSADVIVLDWRLPSGPGVELLPQLERRGIQVPVVFLTGAPATTYESTALECGAMDFVDKARGADILTKRLRLIVEAGKRQPQAPAEDVVQCGRLQLRPLVSRAYWDSVDVALTVTEFNIVHMLVVRAGEYVTYRAIYDRVHRVGFIAGSGEDGYRTNVRSSVKRIRNKFRSLDADFSEIENFPAFGYRWRSAPGFTA